MDFDWVAAEEEARLSINDEGPIDMPTPENPLEEGGQDYTIDGDQILIRYEWSLQRNEICFILESLSNKTVRKSYSLYVFVLI